MDPKCTVIGVIVIASEASTAGKFVQRPPSESNNALNRQEDGDDGVRL